MASRSIAQDGDHRWAGLSFDTFALDTATGVEAWTAEDGGRIRHRDPASGEWNFQTTPADAKDTLHRTFFLDSSKGWAVGQGGIVLKTVNGGATWTLACPRITNQAPGIGRNGNDPYEELYDIHFLSSTEGWMVGVHSFWHTDDGGASWTELIPVDFTGAPYSFDLEPIEMYAIDIVVRADGTRIGLLTGQPGIIFRNLYPDPGVDPHLASWKQVWDVTSLCGSGQCGSAGHPLQGLECDICGSHPSWYEAWDIEISEKTDPKLALLVGGIGTFTGMIFASADDGTTWTKEVHECNNCAGGPPCTWCHNLPAYTDDPNDQSSTDLNRHTSFRTLYGVGIFDSDNSAIAAGYNAQHVVRNPATGIWEDRSVFAAPVPPTPGAVVFPLIGAEAVTRANGTKFGTIGGEGGHLRESQDGGNTWVNAVANGGLEIVGEPHRIQDVWFKDDSFGWRVGQFFRIAKTVNGGSVWNIQAPQPNNPLSAGNFWAIEFEPNGQIGVAVGDPVDPGATGSTHPQIYYTGDGGAFGWSTSPAFTADPAFMNGKALLEVTRTPSGAFWSVGQGGLILRSIDGGQRWRQIAPESLATLSEFELEGVAFVDTSTGLFAGRRPDANGAIRGAIYQYTDLGGGSFTWTALALPSGVTITSILDVEIAGNAAWAVGEERVNNVIEGIVLTATASGGTFGALTEVANPNGFTACLTGKDLVDKPILEEVEVAPNTGDVWVGGMCGRVWVKQGTGPWVSVKSDTDAHIVGMSFVPLGTTGAAGYLAGFRASQTAQCIVRVQ